MKVNLKFLSTSLFLFFVSSLSSQDASFEWVAQIGAESFDRGKSITTDNSDNVISVGTFGGTVDFDPGDGVTNLTTDNSDLFVQKLSGDGDLLWVKQIGGNGAENPNHVLTDSLDNIYVTGRFSQSVDFDPGVAEFVLDSDGSVDCYILKLDTNGDFVWAKRMGGESFDNSYALALDGNENLYTVGVFQATADFDPGTAEFTITSNGLNDFFIQKLDPEGNFLWVKSSGGTEQDFGVSIAIDELDNVLITGSFKETVDFDPSIEEENLTSMGLNDGYIQKLDSNGNLIWVKHFRGDDVVSGGTVKTDDEGNIYQLGYFKESADFDPSEVVYTQTSNGHFDIFLEKLSPSGDFIWVRYFGGADSDLPHSMEMDEFGEIYITGDFHNSISFDVAGIPDLQSNGDSDMLLAKYNSEGIIQWAKEFGGSGTDRSESVTVDTNNNIYLTGSFENQVDFDPSSQTANLTSSNEVDAFILKFNQGSTTAVHDENPLENTIVYPNPSTGEIIIEMGGLKTNVRVVLSNNLGQIISAQEFEYSDLPKINITAPAGIYFLQLTTKDSITKTVKVIKE